MEIHSPSRANGTSTSRELKILHLFVVGIFKISYFEEFWETFICSNIGYRCISAFLSIVGGVPVVTFLNISNVTWYPRYQFIYSKRLGRLKFDLTSQRSYTSIQYTIQRSYTSILYSTLYKGHIRVYCTVHYIYKGHIRVYGTLYKCHIRVYSTLYKGHIRVYSIHYTKVIYEYTVHYTKVIFEYTVQYINVPPLNPEQGFDVVAPGEGECTVRKYNWLRYCLALCDEIFDHFPLYCSWLNFTSHRALQ